MSEVLNSISELMQKGKANEIVEEIKKALDSGVKADEILKNGLMAGMDIIGEKFKNDEIFIPEVLIAARAMKKGSEVLKPFLTEGSSQSCGKVCVGTVKGDLHDIGKNLVVMMLEGKGVEVVDLGVDVEPSQFVDTAVEQGCKVILCSSLLTTTMEASKEVVKILNERGLHEKIKVMVGGAPVNQEFCNAIGADCYTEDAASAADACVEILKSLN